MLRSERYQHYFSTVQVIARSPSCTEFMIGYTARAGRMRLAEYNRIHGYQHLVIIADRMTQSAALRLERELQTMVKNDKRDISYRKYAAYNRDAGHRASAGSYDPDPGALTHSVYMAWWTDSAR